MSGQACAEASICGVTSVSQSCSKQLKEPGSANDMADDLADDPPERWHSVDLQPQILSCASDREERRASWESHRSSFSLKISTYDSLSIGQYSKERTSFERPIMSSHSQILDAMPPVSPRCRLLPRSRPISNSGSVAGSQFSKKSRKTNRTGSSEKARSPAMRHEELHDALQQIAQDSANGVVAEIPSDSDESQDSAGTDREEEILKTSRPGTFDFANHPLGEPPSPGIWGRTSWSLDSIPEPPGHFNRSFDVESPRSPLKQIQGKVYGVDDNQYESPTFTEPIPRILTWGSDPLSPIKPKFEWGVGCSSNQKQPVDRSFRRKLSNVNENPSSRHGSKQTNSSLQHSPVPSEPPSLGLGESKHTAEEVWTNDKTSAEGGTIDETEWTLPNAAVVNEAVDTRSDKEVVDTRSDADSLNVGCSSDAGKQFSLFEKKPSQSSTGSERPSNKSFFTLSYPFVSKPSPEDSSNRAGKEGSIIPRLSKLLQKVTWQRSPDSKPDDAFDALAGG